ncbi:MAG: hypothetical protein ABI661_03150 [Gammaproteobacteria bacterium]
MPGLSLRRFLPFVLVAVHFVAVPCAMALGAAGAAAPCGHCDSGLERSPCMSPSAEPTVADAGPVRAGGGEPVAPDVILMRLPPLTGAAGSHQAALIFTGPARSTGFRTGRHAGDPPLRISFGKFLN